MDEQKTRALMELLPGVYNTTLLTPYFKRYFEIALGFWLSGGGQPDKKFDYFKYSSYMGGSLDPSVPLPLDAKDSIVPLAQGKYFLNYILKTLLSEILNLKSNTWINHCNLKDLNLKLSTFESF